MKPSLVICQCDQLRACSVGCYGDTAARTPHIDRLAREGVRFANAFTNNPVCTPARSCLLSGQYGRTCTGGVGNVEEDPPNPRRVRLMAPTLAEAARAAGYRTAHIGKWHVDPQPQLVGFDTARYPSFIHKYYDQTYYDEQARPRQVAEFGGDYDARQAAAFLEGVGDTPFLLHYNISLPHQPIGRGHLPDRYVDLFHRDEVPLRANVQEEGDPAVYRRWFKVYTSSAFWWHEYTRGGYKGPEWLPPGFGVRDLTALYYGAVACADALLGRLLDDLDRLRLADRTVIVFLSDHGDNLGSHGRFNKDVLLEESIHIPLLVRWPDGIPRGRVASPLTQTIDVMPTVLDLADLPVPGTVQGRSQRAALAGADAPPNEAVFIETPFHQVGIRTPGHLYGVNVDRTTRRIGTVAHFYDLHADPYQQRNLAGSGEQASTAAALHNRLAGWHVRTPWLEG